MQPQPDPWVNDANAALLTDLYQLTMLRAYHREERRGTAVFSLFVRRLPAGRRYLIACGLDAALRYLEELRFDERATTWLRSTGRFDSTFIDWLAQLRFTGDVWAVPEGTPVFAEEPILEVVAPLPEAQLAETFVMNQVMLQTMLASKAARVVTAARGRTVIDFGLRRMHGADAGLKSARAFHIAGVAATSNVLAGMTWGVPIAGTMAHSYVQSHDDEPSAFRDFTRAFPATVLLVDTYDTLEGVRNVTRLARELGDDFNVQGIRLDSGDLADLARQSRAILDQAGLAHVSIFASGGLDEYEIDRLLEMGAPIDGFGVGTEMGVSGDAPSLDMVYKLAEYGGRGRLKLSAGKRVLPGRKQVFRFEDDDVANLDVIAGADERLGGRPLLHKVMEGGRRLANGEMDLDTIRSHAAVELARLPAAIRSIRNDEASYPVSLSPDLERAWRQLAQAAAL